MYTGFLPFLNRRVYSLLRPFSDCKMSCSSLVEAVIGSLDTPRGTVQNVVPLRIVEVNGYEK